MKKYSGKLLACVVGNMVKKAIGILTSLVLLVLICLPTQASSIQNGDAKQKSEIEQLMDDQENAVEAHELLYSSFDFKETYIYPDGFGGDYIENNILVIYYCDDEFKKNSSELLGKYKSSIEYRYKKLPLNALMAASESLFSELSAKYDIVSYGPAIIENAIQISLKDGGKQQFPELLFQKDNKLFYKYQNISVQVLISYVETSAEQSSYPGSSKLRKSSGARFTMAANAISQYQENGFLTCGHGQTLTASIYIDNSLIGYTQSICYPSINSISTYGDYSFIKAIPAVSLSKKYIALPFENQYSYTGKILNPAIGQVLTKYGQASGRAEVRVSDVNQTTVYALTSNVAASIHGMSYAEITNGDSLNGDSGGPYVYLNRFSGIHHGISTSSDGSVKVIFTPYVYPYNDGFRIYTGS